MLPLAFTSVAVVQMKKLNFFQTDSFETQKHSLTVNLRTSFIIFSWFLQFWLKCLFDKHYVSKIYLPSPVLPLCHPPVLSHMSVVQSKPISIMRVTVQVVRCISRPIVWSIFSYSLLQQPEWLLPVFTM